MTIVRQPSGGVPPSPDDGSNFRRSLQIDMKGLVGDAVGNMSISPGSRDVVLAARKGLFIIDLEAPLNVPRFLPQGGTWDVADVQWNPHMTRKEYIVSTSSERLLIWNLYLSGKTSIQHILRSHYRAITDINWHNTDPEVVVSTGIDSWLWAWDLREPKKPVMGLCAFNAGGTQVKWNRQDGNILASSHANEVLIWDRRKGSLPVSRIQAHSAKIYGIDWAHERRNELVTCSLDKTIKIWDIQKPINENGYDEPTHIIHTTYPVWRARDLPFGHGILSLPQRGETALEMWTPESFYEPVERFEGHADVVKEFVWRKGGHDNSEFQLITWSKDRTLRFWPVDAEVMQKVGGKSNLAPSLPTSSNERVSFSSQPVSIDLTPALSAPVGNRSILAEVRATQPHRPGKVGALRNSHEFVPTQSSIQGDATLPVKEKEKAGTMSRGYVGGRSAQITTFAWLSSVKVGGPREGSSGPPSGGESAAVSRFNSRSRAPSTNDPSGAHLERLRSISRDKGEEDHKEEANQTLQEEITSVVNKLTASKVKLERADLTKRRTCTFGLHGPWGDSTSVFIRISFSFPKDYPQASHPGGTPRVELERNPLISFKSRIYILRRLRNIRETQRPCLEACLRFLLFGDENPEHRPVFSDSESSDDEIYREGFSLSRGDKNLAEPRTCQGVFGPNGELVCFFRAPPRIVRNPLREISHSPSGGSRNASEMAPRLFWSPVLLSDAIRRLAVISNDRDVETIDAKTAEDAHSILRIMSNLFTFPHYKVRRVSENSRPMEDVPNSYSLLPTRRSTVFISDASAIVGTDINMARDYVFPCEGSISACETNAEVATLYGRSDHERVFNILRVLLKEARKPPPSIRSSLHGMYNPLNIKIMEKLYAELALNKDIQMLAMVATVFLQLSTDLYFPLKPDLPAPTLQKVLHVDYFNYNHSLTQPPNQGSPAWSRTSPSPTTGQPVAPALSSPSSSRGSWSSLFNASSMRRFISVSKGTANNRFNLPLPSPHLKETRRDSQYGTTSASKSWSETTGTSTEKTSVSFSSAGHTRRPTFSQVVGAQGPPTEKRVLVEIIPQMRHQSRPAFRLPHELRQQLEAHIWAYADMLLTWQLPEKRAELLKATRGEMATDVSHNAIVQMLDSSPLGIVRVCTICGSECQPGTEFCSCGGRLAPERCSVCRLPIKGLSHTCLVCLHPTHIQCWRARKDPYCATGCGCLCSEPNGRLPPPIIQSPMQYETYM